MKKILLRYLADMMDKRTRPFAYAIAMQHLEYYREFLTIDQVKDLMLWLNDFSQNFSKTWFWKRNFLIAQSIRELNN